MERRTRRRTHPESSAGQRLDRPGRIPRATVDLYRTRAVEIGPYGGTLAALSLSSLPAEYDANLMANVRSGQKRRWGMAGWSLDAALHVRRTGSRPFNVRSVVYDLRW